MEFKEIGSNEYFPPTLPNGEIYGYVNEGGFGRPALHLMTVCDDGLRMSGVFINWSSIDALSVTGNSLTIHNHRYPSDFCFLMTGMKHIADGDDVSRVTVAGYPVGYTLLNRITFELQRLEDADDLDVF